MDFLFLLSNDIKINILTCINIFLRLNSNDYNNDYTKLKQQNYLFNNKCVYFETSIKKQ